MSIPFIATTTVGDMYQSTTWFKNIPINIQDFTLYANLIDIDMADYNVTLGMDWLSTHHVLIDY